MQICALLDVLVGVKGRIIFFRYRTERSLSVLVFWHGSIYGRARSLRPSCWSAKIIRFWLAWEGREVVRSVGTVSPGLVEHLVRFLSIEVIVALQLVLVLVRVSKRDIPSLAEESISQLSRLCLRCEKVLLAMHATCSASSLCPVLITW